MKIFCNKNKIESKRGYISTILILILLSALFFYYFSTKSKGDVQIVDGENYAGYLDYNTVTLNTIEQLKSDEIKISENNSQLLKVKNYSINIKRGENLKIDNTLYAPYLFETIDEKYPNKMYQFLVIGISETQDIFEYYLVYFRNKRI